jgi:superkiller protein 3
MKNILTVMLLALVCAGSINAQNAQNLQDDAEMGNTCLKSGDYSKAITYYQKVIDNCNEEILFDISAVYFNMGEAYMGLKDYVKSVACYQKLIEIEPNYNDGFSTLADVYFNMGYAYMGLEDYEKSVACYKKLIEIDPHRADAYDCMAVGYDKLGNMHERDICAKKAEQLRNEK